MITTDPQPLKATRSSAGWHLSGPYDPQQRWRTAGARNLKTPAGWVAAVADVATLTRCATVRGPIQVDEDTARQVAAGSRALASSRASESAVDFPAPDGLSYLPYQRAGIQFALRVFGDSD